MKILILIPLVLLLALTGCIEDIEDTIDDIIDDEETIFLSVLEVGIRNPVPVTQQMIDCSGGNTPEQVFSSIIGDRNWIKIWEPHIIYYDSGPSTSWLVWIENGVHDIDFIEAGTTYEVEVYKTCTMEIKC